MRACLASSRTAVLLISLLFSSVCLRAQEEFALRLRPEAGGWELRWQVRTGGAAAMPVFAVQESGDCVNWTTVASGLTSADGVLTWRTGPAGLAGFYRVVSDQKRSATGEGGEEVFGYARAFREQLARIGPISQAEFAARYPSPDNYLDRIDFDIAQAAYWDRVNSKEPIWGNGPSGPVSVPGIPLNTDEISLLQRNGFVASARLGTSSCLEMYYDIYRRDLPVLVTTDSILQAWHRSFDGILEELETTYLSARLEELLGGMANEIPGLWQRHGETELRESLLDADYFLSVARSLLAGSQQPSSLGQEAWVRETLQAVADLAIRPFNLFGRLERDPDFVVDFSQFQPRGHYAKTEALKRYFRAMMWCGRIDLRVAGNAQYASPRELGTAMVLAQALGDAGQGTNWARMNGLLEALVGRVDSLTFAQLTALLEAAPVKSLAEVTSLADLRRIQQAIESFDLGFQQIASDLYFAPEPGVPVRLPRSFTVLGQRFTLDSWAMQQVVYDRILAPDGNGLVPRRIPSALDVAFAVFGNDQATPVVTARMANPNGRKFRDGLPYQHNLAAARATIDGQRPTVWGDNVYSQWLAALRELSVPTTDVRYPECMRTRAWAMKNLNTQLASWTHLRHDTILHVKQSYTPPILCSYPLGYVEPVPGFWRRLASMADGAADRLQNTPMAGVGHHPDSYGLGLTFEVDLAAVGSNQVAFLRRFAGTMRALETMAAKELAQQPFSAEESAFLEDVVQKKIDYFGFVTYSGWYPKLHYRDAEGFDGQSYFIARGLGLTPLPFDSENWDALVADVHTDGPDEVAGDPGMVLHEGVGSVNRLIAAIDSGTDRAVYCGPVLSHYEFEQPLGSRLTDEEWKARLTGGLAPPTPEWTRDYLAP